MLVGCSITLGGFGADRFYLGLWREGIGKLFSFGGLGVWTIVDVILVATGYIGPADGSLYIVWVHFTSIGVNQSQTLWEANPSKFLSLPSLLLSCPPPFPRRLLPPKVGSGAKPHPTVWQLKASQKASVIIGVNVGRCIFWEFVVRILVDNTPDAWQIPFPYVEYTPSLEHGVGMRYEHSSRGHMVTQHQGMIQRPRWSFQDQVYGCCLRD